MCKRFALPFAVLACLWSVVNSSIADVEFRVGVAMEAAAKPVSGRLIIFLIKEGAKLRPGAEPLDGPFWDDPQPIFGMDVANLSPDSGVVVDSKADGFPVGLGDLAPGQYRAQARLDIVREDSSWRRQGGNLYSDVVDFRVQDRTGNSAVRITLSHTTEQESPKNVEGLEWFEMRSTLLSAFRGKEVKLRAGVVFPKNYDAGRKYAAVYEVPGFGGNHLDATRVARARVRNFGDDALAKSSFWIVLDPEGPNGHTLFADSANNGPCGEALVKELIPALEAKFGLVASASGRLLRGHSSGGWSTLWLATTYPETFGACWSSSPDPVDFRRFQRINIYEQGNMYVQESAGAKAQEIASYRGRGTIMTVRQETRGEDVLGPDNTSAQQWDSWFAVFGPRNERGHPAALFDPASGAIDKAMAQRYRSYDIADRLRNDPAKYVPIFRERVRIIVGDQDSFFLNEAVELLKADLEQASKGVEVKDPAWGSITIVPGADHGTVFMSKEVRAIPKEMAEHLERAGYLVQ